MHLRKTVEACPALSAAGRRKLLKIMKVFTVIMLAATLQVSASGFAQVTLSETDVPLSRVMKKFQRQTGMDFLYSVELLQKAGNVSVRVTNVSVEEAMRACLVGKNLSFNIVNNTVVVSPRALKPVPSVSDQLPMGIPVTGRLVDESGQPLIGVTVTVKGTSLGTVSDQQGYFSFRDLDENAILVFSSVNLETFEMPVKSRRDIGTLMLKKRVTETQEVVVVSTGYQTISKERATGSFGKVTDEVLSKRPVANIADALNGQIAGVVRDPNTGFVIRGRSSLSGTSDRLPLLVVDGFPIEGGFETINPNDVRSIDVLKDAAATSIYGARASNGVIVITTKGSGPKGRTNIQYNGFVSVGSQIDLDYYMNMLNSQEHIAFDDSYYNLYKGTTTIRDPWTSTTFRGRLGEYYTLLAERDKGNITQDQFDREKARMQNGNYKEDYDKYVLRNSVAQQHNIILSGSGEKNAYKVSFLYDNDKTYLQNNNNNRYMITLGNTLTITPKIKYIVNGNLTFFRQENNGVNLAYAKSVTSPWTRVFDDNGNYARHIHAYYEPVVQQWEARLPYSLRYNFVEEAALRDNLNTGQDIRFQNELEFSLAKGLRVRPMFQYEFQQNDSRSVYDERSFAARNAGSIIASPSASDPNVFVSQLPAGGLYRYNSGQKRNAMKFRVQADYVETFNRKHEVAAAAGGEVLTSRIEANPQDLKYGYSAAGLNYALFDYNVARNNIWGENIVNSPPTYENQSILIPSSFSRQAVVYNERYVAGYANASYTYDRRYTVTGSVRTDASNYISRTNRERFSPFFSAGFRWNMANENFMRNVKFVDRLALRLTYGSTGNAAGKTSLIPFSVFSNQAPNAETGNYPNGAISGRQNDALTWEKTYSTNIATDFSLFRGKLTGSVDFYHRLSKDLLTQVQTSNVIWSTSSQTINAAEVLNKGVEITLGTNINLTKDLNWSAGVNFDYNQNKVLEYNFLATRLSNYVNGTTFVAGVPIDRIFAVKLAGTAKEGYYIQEKKTGELVPEVNSNNSFGGFGTIANTIPGMSILDDSRVYYMGRSTPPMTLGFTNAFSWKGLTLMAVITGRFGHLVRRTDTNIFFSQGAVSYSKTGMDAIQPLSKVATDQTGNLPPTVENRLTHSNSAQTRAFYSDVTLEKADHLRFNELYLGYEFPAGFLSSKMRLFRSATVYTQARNLGIIWTANESGIDPEYIPGTLKPIKTFTFGVRFGF